MKNIALFFEELLEANPANPLKPGITKREAEILFWMTKDNTDADIAGLGGVFVRTVHKHREYMFIKSDVETRTAAAMPAIEIMLPL